MTKVVFDLFYFGKFYVMLLFNKKNSYYCFSTAITNLLPHYFNGLFVGKLL